MRAAICYALSEIALIRSNDIDFSRSSVNEPRIDVLIWAWSDLNLLLTVLPIYVYAIHTR